MSLALHLEDAFQGNISETYTSNFLKDDDKTCSHLFMEMKWM